MPRQKNTFRRTRVKIATVLSVLILLGGTAYGMVWRVLAHNLETQGRITIENLRHSGMMLETQSLAVSGFPRTPELRFSGILRLPSLNIQAEIPDLRVRSFLIPALPFTAEIAQPVKFSGAANIPGILRLAESLQQARATIILPVRWPRDTYEDTLRKWREDGGKITIREIFVAFAGGAALSGAGDATLDSDLNPEGKIDLALSDPASFIALLEQTRLLEKDNAAIATMVTSALAKPDEKTGRPVMRADLSLSNRVLTIGPLKIGELPRAAWPQRPPALDRRNSPAPLR